MGEETPQFNQTEERIFVMKALSTRFGTALANMNRGSFPRDLSIETLNNYNPRELIAFMEELIYKIGNCSEQEGVSFFEELEGGDEFSYTVSFHHSTRSHSRFDISRPEIPQIVAGIVELTEMDPESFIQALQHRDNPELIQKLGDMIQSKVEIPEALA